jgi:hypothetical protein
MDGVRANSGEAVMRENGGKRVNSHYREMDIAIQV